MSSHACDIIMIVWNQLAFTTDCINSVLKNTDGEYRLILIDNASDNPTRDYLMSVQRSQGNRVLLVRNDTNLGFIKAANQGMQISKAPHLCLLNNDTIVTKGWLSEMIAIADSSPDIGIVNPSSNNLGQKPADGEPIELFAERFKSKAGTYSELGAAIGFCMLIKHAVIERIGYFDEIYGMGNFEDTDFSRKAVKDGFRCVRACGAYVYHREHTSFNKAKTFSDDFKRNREIFEFRWGKPRRIAYILDDYDDIDLAHLKTEALKLARDGNWVSYFLRQPLAVPEHANIQAMRLAPKNFHLTVIFNILKKKKKFDKILVGDERFGKLLAQLSFIHKAKVACY